jgi:hypothetical protein
MMLVYGILILTEVNAWKLTVKCEIYCCIIVWHNCPMRELLKFRNFEERDCATIVEHCRVLPPLPSPLFTPHHVLLGCTVTTGSHNSKEGPRDLRDITRNNTQRFVLRMSDSSIYKSDNWEVSQCSSVVSTSQFSSTRSEFSEKWISDTARSVQARIQGISLW